MRRAVSANLEAAPSTVPGARRARASSRSTCRRMALALFSISSASAPSPFSRSARMSEESTCNGVFSPCARSPARARARAIAFSWLSSSRLISSASGCTSVGATPASRGRRRATTSRTASRSACSGARPTVICTKIAATSTSPRMASAGASSRRYSLTDSLTVAWSSATLARNACPLWSMTVRSTATSSELSGPGTSCNARCRRPCRRRQRQQPNPTAIASGSARRCRDPRSASSSRRAAR